MNDHDHDHDHDHDFERRLKTHPIWAQLQAKYVGSETLSTRAPYFQADEIRAFLRANPEAGSRSKVICYLIHAGLKNTTMHERFDFTPVETHFPIYDWELEGLKKKVRDEMVDEITESIRSGEHREKPQNPLAEYHEEPAAGANPPEDDDSPF